MQLFRVSVFLCLLTTRAIKIIRNFDDFVPTNINILLLIADDLGIGDLGCYGNLNAKTPNIDKLAKEGLKLTRMYSVPSDTGSIAGILTGKEPKIYGFVKGRTGAASFNSPAQTGGIPYGQHTKLQQLFSKNKMGAFYTGQWNLGFGNDKIPTSSGFQSFFGTLLPYGMACSSDRINSYTDSDYFWERIHEYLPYITSVIVVIILARYTGIIGNILSVILIVTLLVCISVLRIHCWSSAYNPNSCIFMENNVIHEQPYRDDRITLRLTDHTVKFIKYRAKRVQPFLYVMSFMQPRFPSVRSYMFRNRTGLGPYADAVHELDWSVGKILKALEENKLYNNTLVIFVSDNSPIRTHPITKKPLKKDLRGQSFVTVNQNKVELRGEKGSNLEGGLRVPAIIRFPGKTKKKSVSNVVTSVLDIYATIIEAAGFNKLSQDKKFDGRSLMPLIKNPSLKPSSVIHDQLYHYCDLAEIGAVTVGDIKIHFRNSTETDCSGPALEQPIVYNITADPRESTPLHIKDYVQLLYHIKASIKKYEMTSGIKYVQHSQFDEISMPYNFPCLDFLSCNKTYELTEDFNTIIY